MENKRRMSAACCLFSSVFSSHISTADANAVLKIGASLNLSVQKKSNKWTKTYQPVIRSDIRIIGFHPVIGVFDEVNRPRVGRRQVHGVFTLAVLGFISKLNEYVLKC